MRYGLHNAAKELKEDIEKYGIIIDTNHGLVGYKNELTPVPEGTTRVVCRRYIRSFIKQAKEEEAARLMKKQPTLFEMDCAA